MPASNWKAYELKNRGICISVVCAECGRTVWSKNATYIVGKDEWYCNKCNDR